MSLPCIDDWYYQHMCVYFKEDDEDGLSPSHSSLQSTKQTLNFSQTSLDTSLSKQELLDNKQDLLSLKEEFAKLKKSIIDPEPSSTASDDFQDFESYESQQQSALSKQNSDKTHSAIPHSVTCDSITECQGKGYTPSMTSSGYGSQAVSTLTLSSEDSLSLRSNDDSEGHRHGRKNTIEHTSSGDSDGDDLGQGQSSNLSTEKSEVKDITKETLEEKVKDHNLNGGMKDAVVSGSSTTLQNLDMDKYEDDGQDSVGNEDENVDMEKVSLKSDLTEESVDDMDEAADGVDLHISEEDLSDTQEGKHSHENVQSEAGGVDGSKTGGSGNSGLINNSAGGSKHGTGKEVEEDVRLKDHASFGAEQKNNVSEESVANDTKSFRNSDSSSNTSRGPIHSDSIDPYSLDALEELERLGDEFGPDNSEFTMNETGDNLDNSVNKSVTSVGASGCGAGVVTPHKTEKGLLNDSLGNCDLDLRPENQSTPKLREGVRTRGVRSEPRQRPVSCIVGSSEVEMLEGALQERNKRSSLDLSDERLSGEKMGQVRLYGVNTVSMTRSCHGCQSTY